MKIRVNDAPEFVPHHDYDHADKMELKKIIKIL